MHSVYAIDSGSSYRISTESCVLDFADEPQRLNLDFAFLGEAVCQGNPACTINAAQMFGRVRSLH
jgi:hypothetical protein